MSLPYSHTFTLTTTVDGGLAPVVFELRFPARGTLTQWGLKVASEATPIGTADVALFPDAASAAANDITRRLLTKSAMLPWSDDVNKPYINREGSPTNPVRRLYLRVAPSDGMGLQILTLELTALQPELPS